MSMVLTGVPIDFDNVGLVYYTKAWFTRVVRVDSAISPSYVKL